MKSIIAIFVMAIATASHATSNDHGKPDNSKPQTSPVTQQVGIFVKQSARAEARAQAKASARSSAAATGGAGTGGSASGGTGIGGNSEATGGSALASISPMNFSFTNVAPTQPALQRIETTGTVTVRQAAAIAHQLGSPTATCRDVVGLGGSGPGGSGLLSFNIGVDWCRDAELSRQARIHGMNDTADDLFCNIERVKELNTPDCSASRKRAEENERSKQAPAESQNVAFSSAG